MIRDDLALRRAIEHLGFPPGRLQLVTDGMGAKGIDTPRGGVIGTDRIWDSADLRKIEMWDEHHAACFPSSRSARE
jgi:hypothetical protein